MLALMFVPHSVIFKNNNEEKTPYYNYPFKYCEHVYLNRKIGHIQWLNHLS